MSAVYVVRNEHIHLEGDKECYLRSYEGGCTVTLRDAVLLTKEQAISEAAGLFRAAYRLRWKLVWFARGERTNGSEGPAIAAPDSPLSHARFDSKEEALRERVAWEYYGADGPDDDCGWKAVPVLRRIKK